MTGERWDPDLAIDADVARAVIGGQFPELALQRVEPFGQGMDNAAFLVDGEWVFRLPRREIGARFMASELRWLPRLAPHLPVAVPAPEKIGEPSDDFPYPFGGYRLLPGRTGCDPTLGHVQREANAAALARFLRALHGIPVTRRVRAEAPHDEIRRAGVAVRAGPLLENLARLGDGIPDAWHARIRRQVEALQDTPPWAQQPVWAHGDLYGRHLLVDDRGALSGVIDWGDLHLGDPAVDLMIAFTWLPARVRPQFFAIYGPVDAATIDRARFRALFYAVLLTLYGETIGDAPLARLGQIALEHVCGPTL